MLAKNGEQKLAKEYVQSLKEYTVYTEEMGRYYDTPRASYSWYDYKIPTEVAAIEAIQAVTPQDQQTVDEMHRWLLQEKRTQAWDTPINSVNAIWSFLSSPSHQRLLSNQHQGHRPATLGPASSYGWPGLCQGYRQCSTRTLLYCHKDQRRNILGGCLCTVPAENLRGVCFSKRHHRKT